MVKISRTIFLEEGGDLRTWSKNVETVLVNNSSEDDHGLFAMDLVSRMCASKFGSKWYTKFLKKFSLIKYQVCVRPTVLGFRV